MEKGTLAILVGSHNLPSFNKIRQTYGQTDVDQDRTPGHFGTDPLAISEQFGGVWKSTDFEAGDVIIFTMHCILQHEICRINGELAVMFGSNPRLI